jgi:hypothetical protein
MTDDDLETLLRGALPPMTDERPERDVWPSLLERVDARHGWAWLDLGLAAAIVIVLAIFPEWLSLLAYHL